MPFTGFGEMCTGVWGNGNQDLYGCSIQLRLLRGALWHIACIILEVRPRDIDVKVISISMVFKSMGLCKLRWAWGIDGKKSWDCVLREHREQVSQKGKPGFEKIKMANWTKYYWEAEWSEKRGVTTGFRDVEVFMEVFTEVASVGCSVLGVGWLIDR